VNCYACCRARLLVTHTYDDGASALRRRRCPSCGLRVLTEERPTSAPARPGPRETLWVLHDRSGERVWIGFEWPEEAPDLLHLGRFIAVDTGFGERFRAHFAAAHLEESWYREQVVVPLRRLLKLDPRGRLGAPSGGPE